jgi:hypothetical protein
MVRRVKIFAVPAPAHSPIPVSWTSKVDMRVNLRGEENIRANTTITLSCWKSDSVAVSSTRVRVLRVTSEVGAKAAEADGSGVDVIRARRPPGTRERITRDHPETLREGVSKHNNRQDTE